MITLDKALTSFTDSLNVESSPNMAYYKENLSSDDYSEFIELSQCIANIHNSHVSEEFDKLFSTIDGMVKNTYGPAGVANFKSTDGVDAATSDMINKIFDEDFE